MSPNGFKGIKYALVGLWIIAVATLLALSLGSALKIYNSRHIEPVPEMTTFHGFRPGVPNELLIWLALTAVLFFLVYRRPSRITLLSAVAAAVFLATNLFFGRHILPLTLIPPTVNRMAGTYLQALAAGDQQAAVRLAGTSAVCQGRTAVMFADHATALHDELAGAWQVKTTLLDLTYDDSLAGGLWMARLIPNQPVEVQAAGPGRQPVTISFTLRYDPIFGRRHLCGN